MKINRIISSALVMAMLLTTLLGVMPISASAEQSTTVSIMSQDKVETDTEKVKAICQEYLKYNFSTAADMLAYELELGYLDYIISGDFAVYVNRYTGFMYYVNNLTGQILTSNPVDPAYQTVEGSPSIVSLGNEVMSQVALEYFALTNTSTVNSYNSLKWIMDGSLLTVSQYGEGGIAVEYILGNASDSFIAPSVILLDTANKYVFYPMFEAFANLMQEKCGDFDSEIAAAAKLKKVTSGNYNVLDNNVYNSSGDYSFYSIKDVLSDYSKYALEYFDKNNNHPDYKLISEHIAHMSNGILSNYDLITPSRAGILVESVGALAKGEKVIMLRDSATADVSLATLRIVERAFKATVPGYSLEMVELHEAECEFISSTISIPSFKVTIAYSIDTNGDLIVDIPTNLISFDETVYSIANISPLKYFGAGDMCNDGYAFYPDGSGMILNFDEFYHTSSSGQSNTAVYVEAPVYGSDYCYSKITGAHREQIVMPVYGIVGDVNANDLGYSASKTTVTNGFFANIEEGASLAQINCLSGGAAHKYITTYAEFSPYPSDTYDLSQSISVSGLSSYTVVVPAHYTGSMKTRYSMLVDRELYSLASALDSDFHGFISDYVGMADCYRDYLEAKGVIHLLEDSYSDLLLYIEALGSVNVTKKVLSFPVTVSTPLTTFDDVARMYSELSNAKDTIIAKADALDSEADALEKENAAKYADTILSNRAKAQKYRELAEKITDIDNINFRLNGFTNGGMHYTYPAKVNWESSVGGKGGFENLLLTSSANTDSDSTFGVYPDFDFMYINNTALFDGVSNDVASCMVDNRYASKQTYNSINQEFESIFALVVSSDSLDSLYNSFIKDYSGYKADGISVSTLGSDLNSNFDEENPVMREDSVANVKALLNRMANDYSVMSDKGNMYAVEYLDHILNVPTDSSHLYHSSQAVPFYGMVLHGYVNYAGAPLNYSGSPEYEILRSIESGASSYYILCTQNMNYLKEDELLSGYYGVDYEHWFDRIVEQYAVLNYAIGDLQQHRISDHSFIMCERVVYDDEQIKIYDDLLSEFLKHVDSAISTKIDKTLKKMRENGKVDLGLRFTVSDEEFDAILLNASERTNVSVEELCELYDFDANLREVIDSYSVQYQSGEEIVELLSDDISYKSKYKYVTDSLATDDNYVKTDYTCDNGNVIMVVYEREVDGEVLRTTFLLNYNVFAVKIKVDETIHPNVAAYCDEDGYIVLDSFDFVKITK